MNKICKFLKITILFHGQIENLQRFLNIKKIHLQQVLLKIILLKKIKVKVKTIITKFNLFKLKILINWIKTIFKEIKL